MNGNVVALLAQRRLALICCPVYPSFVYFGWIGWGEVAQGMALLALLVAGILRGNVFVLVH